MKITMELSEQMGKALHKMARATGTPPDCKGPISAIPSDDFAKELLEVALIKTYEERFGAKIGQL